MNQDDIQQTIESEQIQQLRFVWCDNANVIRAKSVFLPTLRTQTSSDVSLVQLLDQAVTITAALQALPATRDEPAADAGLGPTQDVELRPDWESLTVFGAIPEIATVVCDMWSNSRPWEFCPREYLRRILLLASVQGLRIEAGAELEFFLLRPGDADAFPSPVDDCVYASSVAANRSAEVISDILSTLWEQGIGVDQYSPESGPGQQEITLSHCDPMRLANRIVMARETIRCVARRHGLIASFLPMVYENTTGSGMHVHFSIWNGNQSIMCDSNRNFGISQPAEAFVAGILQHLPAVMATTTPSVNSYRRIRPHQWCGAYQAWGIANKEAAIRLIDDLRTNEPVRVELKTVDASANPYIALATIIAAGLDGVANDATLPVPIGVDPGNLTNHERAELGIAALPRNLKESMTLFCENEVLRKAMGQSLATAYLAVRKAEMDHLEGVSFDQERRLLLERY